MAENFPNLKKETGIQVQEAQRVPNKMNTNRPTPRHIIIKMTKVKVKILKAAREKQRVNEKGTPIKLISLQKHYRPGDFPGGPVVKNPPSNAGDMGSVPGRGTNIPHAAGQLSPFATLPSLHASMREPACCKLQSPRALEPACHNWREACALQPRARVLQ